MVLVTKYSFPSRNAICHGRRTHERLRLRAGLVAQGPLSLLDPGLEAIEACRVLDLVSDDLVEFLFLDVSSYDHERDRFVVLYRLWPFAARGDDPTSASVNRASRWGPVRTLPV